MNLDEGNHEELKWHDQSDLKIVAEAVLEEVDDNISVLSGSTYQSYSVPETVNNYEALKDYFNQPGLKPELI